VPVEQPCAEHFPGGFAEGAYSACCEHGLWYATPPEVSDGTAEGDGGE